MLVLLLAASVGTVAAEEIVHFTNGTSMAIRAHEIIEDMIHVDLGGNALMAFPMDQVDRITEAGKDIYLPESFKPANVTSESRSGVRVGSAGRTVRTGASVSGHTSAGVSASRRRQMARASSLEEMVEAASIDGDSPVQPGLARALPGATTSRARQMRVAGRADAWGGAMRGNGAMSSLPQSASGETKLVIPKYSGPTRQGTVVQRFLPSDQAASAAVAQGKPLRIPPSQTQPPPSSGSDGGSSSSSGSDQ